MNYEEFKSYQRILNPLTKFAHGYQLPDGKTFYIEPWFYTQFTRLEERFPERVSDLVAVMIEKVNRYHHVVFTRDYQNTIIKDERYIAIEIDDLIAQTGIIIDDISRGSDYGD